MLLPCQLASDAGRDLTTAGPSSRNLIDLGSESDPEREMPLYVGARCCSRGPMHSSCDAVQAVVHSPPTHAAWSDGTTGAAPGVVPCTRNIRLHTAVSHPAVS